MPRPSFFILFGVALIAVISIQFAGGRHGFGLQGFFLVLACAALVGTVLPAVSRRSLATVLGFLCVLLGTYGLLVDRDLLGAATSIILGVWAFANMVN